MPADQGHAGVDVGEARVDEHDVGVDALDLLERRAHVGGASDDVDLAGHPEEVGEALQDTAIRINDHHPRSRG